MIPLGNDVNIGSDIVKLSAFLGGKSNVHNI